jgi:hypothetical protein
MVALRGKDLKKQEKWYANLSCPSAAATILAIFVVPIWFALGIVSLGFLWPPQVRRWLFRPAGRIERKRKVAAKDDSNAQVSLMRNEVMKLKLMSYERSGEVERELRELKELLYAAMRE